MCEHTQIEGKPRHNLQVDCLLVYIYCRRLLASRYFACPCTCTAKPSHRAEEKLRHGHRRSNQV